MSYNLAGRQLISSHLDSMQSRRPSAMHRTFTHTVGRLQVVLACKTKIFCILALDLYCMHHPICPHCCWVEARIVLFEFETRKDAKKLPNYQNDQNNVN